MNKRLYQLDKDLKRFLLVFIIVLSTGVLTGLSYLYYTTNYSPAGAVTRFNGSDDITDPESFDIPDTYPKPISEMLISTHNHIIAFSLIFLSLGAVFYFNSIVGGFWKNFLLIEPLISTLVTFSSLWAMRYLHPDFVYLTAVSSLFIYLSFFTMASICIYELLIKK